jgi:hypothetical protein
MRVTLSAKQYDATYAAARRERLTVPEWIRERLREAADR